VNRGDKMGRGPSHFPRCRAPQRGGGLGRGKII
jgi:hypothetical protein